MPSTRSAFLASALSEPLREQNYFTQRPQSFAEAQSYIITLCRPVLGTGLGFIEPKTKA